MKLRILATGAAVSTLCTAAQAVVAFSDVYITGDLGYPASAAKLTLTDSAADTVTVTMEAFNLASGHKISDLYLSLPPGLTIASFAGPTGGTWKEKFPPPDLAYDGLSSPGGVNFDFQVQFETGGDTTKNFGPGDSVSFTFSAPGLDVADFLANTTPFGGKDLLGAIHLQGLAGGGSTTLGFTVPEPSQYAMLAGLGLVGFAAYRRFAR